MAEKCTTCGAEISDSPPAYAWEGRRLCRDCYAFITNTNPPVPARTSRPHPAPVAVANDATPAPPSTLRKAIAGGMLLGLAMLIVVGWILAYQASQREGEAKVREVTPWLKHVDFSPALRNHERFAAPICLALPNGRHYRTIADHPFYVREARTLAICRVSKPELGRYQYEHGSGRGSLVAHRIRLEICFIDLQNPSRRRVVVATSEPPRQIQSESQYYGDATHTFDDVTEPGSAAHDEQVLLEKVLAKVTSG